MWEGRHWFLHPALCTLTDKTSHLFSLCWPFPQEICSLNCLSSNCFLLQSAIVLSQVFFSFDFSPLCLGPNMTDKLPDCFETLITGVRHGGRTTLVLDTGHWCWRQGQDNTGTEHWSLELDTGRITLVLDIGHWNWTLGIGVGDRGHPADSTGERDWSCQDFSTPQLPKATTHHTLGLLFPRGVRQPKLDSSHLA